MTEKTYKELKRYVGSTDDFTDDLLNYGYTKGRADERKEILEILNSPGDAETTVMMLTNYMVRHTIRDALKNKEQK